MEFHVAPMKGITDWKFRKNCLGATDSYTEMIQLREILGNKKRAIDKLDLDFIDGQNQWIQILTNSPREMEKLPFWLNTFCKEFPEKSHIYGININLGCPDPQIISAGQGAALIKRRKRILDLINAFLESTDNSYHLSLKFRLGMNMRDVTMKVLIDVLENLSVIDNKQLKPPIIHFKHVKQHSDETPIWEYLDPLLDAGFSFILNGNISIPQDIHTIRNQLEIKRQRLFKHHMRGIMIGRALISNPSLFLEFQEIF